MAFRFGTSTIHLTGNVAYLPKGISKKIGQNPSVSLTMAVNHTNEQVSFYRCVFQGKPAETIWDLVQKDVIKKGVTLYLYGQHRQMMVSKGDGGRSLDSVVFVNEYRFMFPPKKGEEK